MSYANFWKRTAAYLVDSIIYGIITACIGQVVGLVLGLSMGIYARQSEPGIGILLTMLAISMGVQFICFIAYFVWPESSAWQATIGKKIFGLQVTDLQGQRISFMRSLGRNMGMILSALLLCIGYFMCLWTEKRQCLHDTLANCLVIDNNPQAKQGCIIGAICGIVALFFMILIGGILAAIALPQFSKATERAHAAQAIAQLSSARTAQHLYYTTYHTYATRWDQLDFPPCKTQASTRCETDYFTWELEEQGVAAQRKSSSLSYRLFRAYDPQDKRRDLVCISRDATTKAFCNQLMGHGPSR